MKTLFTVSGLFLLQWVAACATGKGPVYVQPSERVLAATPDGEKVAIYDVATTAGTVAAVKVWSNGVDDGTVDGRPATLVHVGMEVRNTSEGRLRVNVPDFWLELEHTRAVPATRTAVLDVPAGEVRRFVTYYEEPPAGAPPYVVFSLHWALDADGHAYEQVTSFVRDPRLQPPAYALKNEPASKHRRHDRVVIRDGALAQ